MKALPAPLLALVPRSLHAQLLLAIAGALLLAQALSALLLYRAQEARQESALIHTAAFRLVAATQVESDAANDADVAPPRGRARGRGVERSASTPLRIGEARDGETEAELRRFLTDQDVALANLVVTRRAIADDPVWQARSQRRAARLPHRVGPPPEQLLIAAILQPGSAQWLVARVPVPSGNRVLLLTLIGQTAFIYLVLVGAVALLMRRIARPLALLTRRIERFADTRGADPPLEPEGPDDLRRLIVAHNAMEARIAALLDEKDVMLGAIGHDLKTPLAALRVRIESVEDEPERARMATTIEDIVRTLDDILSLARIGRSNEPREMTELSALVGSIVEEYEDLGDPVTMADAPRIVAPLRSTWLRRALRNLIGNALRYGGAARVTLARDGNAAIIRIDDDGPGIAPDQIGRMLEPFIRGDPSRNSETGGAGLGLTLARAIAEQHGGALALANRRAPDGGIAGLTASLRLPLG